MKQDDANRSGGKWIIRLKKGLASRCWENLILAMLGEQFMVGEEICGAVISVRNQVNIQMNRAKKRNVLMDVINLITEKHSWESSDKPLTQIVFFL